MVNSSTKKGQKSKNNQPNGVDESEPVNIKQALPVAYLPEDFDGEPIDGSQYLALVNRNNESLPFFTRVPNPYRQITPDPVVPLVNQLNSEESIPVTRHPAFPTEAWRVLYVAHFMGYRKYLSSRFPPSPRLPIPTNSPRVPAANQRSDWWQFVNGQPRRKIKVLKTPAQVALENEIDEEAMMNDPSGSTNVSGPAQRINYIDEEEAAMNGFSAPATNGNTGGSELDIETIINGEGEYDENEVEVNDENWDEDDERVENTQNEKEDGIAREELEPEAEKHQAREPLISYIQNLNSSEIILILAHFAHWLSENIEQLQTPLPILLPTQPNSPSHYITISVKSLRRPPNPFPELYAHWIFALLSILPSQLSGGEISVLRDLARSAGGVAKWRWGVFSSEEEGRSGEWRLGQRWKEARDDAGLVGIGMGSGKGKGKGKRKSVVDNDDGERKSILLAYDELGLDETLARCWMVIEAVIAGWGQRDLTDEFDKLFDGV